MMCSWNLTFEIKRFKLFNSLGSSIRMKGEFLRKCIYFPLIQVMRQIINDNQMAMHKLPGKDD